LPLHLAFIVLILASIAYFGFKYITGYKKPELNPNPTPENTISVTGVIRSAGLMEEEKVKFGLPNVKYQITDFVQGSESADIYGYYLITNDDTLGSLMGKCVKVAGTVPGEWKEKDLGNPFTYSRSALDLISFENLDYTSCNPYSNITADPSDEQKFTLQGVIIHDERPAPDIGYDYIFTPDKPFYDKFSPAGSGQYTSVISASPSSKNTWIDTENNIGKKVEIEGYMLWGYAESKYFEIISVKPVK